MAGKSRGLERSNVPGMFVPCAGLYGRAPKAMSSHRKRPNTHETPSHIEAAIAIQAYKAMRTTVSAPPDAMGLWLASPL